ncbi:MAG: glycosyl hydrolase, partial [Eudoraea sp.]
GEMENTLTEMHHMVNKLYQANIQLSQVLDNLEESEIKQKGRDLSKRIRKWDEDMIQRKSKAYDDVENFPNKFSAEYLFLINETSSSIPRVNTSNRNRKVELDRQWEVFKSEGNSILKEAIPEFNKNLWELGIGAIRY